MAPVPAPEKHRLSQILNLTVFVAALGYFVDMFDLLLFPIVRQPSLTDLGIPQGDAQIPATFLLLNSQMVGMLLGGIFWGVLGDKKGRLSTLFGSIALYSVANIANAFVHGLPSYAVLALPGGARSRGRAGRGGDAGRRDPPEGPSGLRHRHRRGGRHLRDGDREPRRQVPPVAHGLPRRGRAGARPPRHPLQPPRERHVPEPRRAGRRDARRLPEPLHPRRALPPLPPLHPHRPADLVRGGDPHHLRARVRPEGRRDGTRGRGDRRGLLLQRDHAGELRLRHPQPGLGKPQEGRSRLHPRDALRRRRLPHGARAHPDGVLPPGGVPRPDGGLLGRLRHHRRGAVRHEPPGHGGHHGAELRPGGRPSDHRQLLAAPGPSGLRRERLGGGPGLHLPRPGLPSRGMAETAGRDLDFLE